VISYFFNMFGFLFLKWFCAPKSILGEATNPSFYINPKSILVYCWLSTEKLILSSFFALTSMAPSLFPYIFFLYLLCNSFQFLFSLCIFSIFLFQPGFSFLLILSSNNFHYALCVLLLPFDYTHIIIMCFYLYRVLSVCVVSATKYWYLFIYF
jgi:hypothetical protein